VRIGGLRACRKWQPFVSELESLLYAYLVRTQAKCTESEYESVARRSGWSCKQEHVIGFLQCEK